MAYNFEGVFIERPDKSDEELGRLFDGTARSIQKPFVGAVISFRDDENRGDSKTHILRISRQFPDSRLAYLKYDTFGGMVDYAAGFACQNGVVIAGSERDSEAESEADDAAEVLPALLKMLGVRRPSLHFPPFERGYFPNT